MEKEKIKFEVKGGCAWLVLLWIVLTTIYFLINVL